MRRLIVCAVVSSSVKILVLPRRPGESFSDCERRTTHLFRSVCKVGAELFSRFDLLNGAMFELMSGTSASSAVAFFDIDVNSRLGAMNKFDL